VSHAIHRFLSVNSFFAVHASDARTKRYFPDNSRLGVLFQEDQDDRHGFPNTKRTYEEINERDEARRKEILALLARGKVRTAQEYFYSAVIFHHDQTTTTIEPLPHSPGSQRRSSRNRSTSMKVRPLGTA